ncbi:MAG: hypothetical protein M3R61_09760, partial [Chloroflexota bacterium]|nr:hypothetical protein [Chloroflexota bacterium]
VYVAENTIPMGTGWTYQYQVVNPDPGEWTIVAQTANANDLTILGTVATSTALSLRTSKQTYQPGESVMIEAVLSQDGAIIPGATVGGQVEGPDGTLIALVFGDTGNAGDAVAGDGVLTTQIAAPSTNGFYAVDLNATKDALVRIQTGSFAITDLSAQIQSVVSTELRDTNSNALTDALDLTVGIMVTRAGHFELAGTLVDGAGNQIDTAVTATRLEGGYPLAVGSQLLTLHFDGKAIRRHGASGPYTLTNLVLYDQTGSSLVIDTATNLYTTSPYQVDLFERVAILFTAGIETLIDDDQNGLYDVLDISVQFDLISAGNYSWNGRLVDQKGGEISWFVGEGFLDNSTPAHFSFNGARIGRGGHAGPYLLRDVSLYKTSAGTANGIFTRLYTTVVSDYRVFEDSRKVFLSLLMR